MDFWYELLGDVCGNGHLLVLHYLSELHGHEGVIAAAGSTYTAVAGGHIGVLEYLLECGCEFDEELETCADEPASLPAWQWIHEVRVPPRAPGEPPGSRPPSQKGRNHEAAADGRLRQNHLHFFDEFEGREYFCKCAASGGCVDILKWAIDVDIFDSWCYYEASAAAQQNGHTELADWLEDRHNKEAQCPACAGRGTVAACEVDQIYME